MNATEIRQRLEELLQDVRTGERHSPRLHDALTRAHVTARLDEQAALDDTGAEGCHGGPGAPALPTERCAGCQREVSVLYTRRSRLLCISCSVL